MRNNINNQNVKGFTLIEILVVISIIGFVAAAAMYTVTNTRMKSRDTKRLADMKTITKALEIYYDKYAAYPVANGWKNDCSGSSAFENALQLLVDEDILNPIPKDPNNPNNTGLQCYWYSTENTSPPCPSVDNNRGYILAFQLEVMETSAYPFWSVAYPDFYCVTP
jgi:prepilin-type N-terminal cleavage/methylation domain-containing protein